MPIAAVAAFARFSPDFECQREPQFVMVPFLSSGEDWRHPHHRNRRPAFRISVITLAFDLILFTLDQDADCLRHALDDQ